jgi:hypothetical protein
MRCRHFNSRSDMIAVLANLRLLSEEEAQRLEKFDFRNSCPLYSSEVEQDVLEAHGFRQTS